MSRPLTKEGRTYTFLRNSAPYGVKIYHQHFYKNILATYHNSVSVVKRSAGKSAVAAAAYRSGDKLKDERTGLTHDYTRKSGVDKSVILTPVKTDWIADRAKLWNKVEAAEKRSDAQLAREITVAIPRELSKDKQINLVCEYIQANYVDLGMIADINFHHLDGDNPHAHIMLTMRDLKIDERGDVSFGNKNRDWNHKDLLIKNREDWAKVANRYLIEAGYPDIQIDHRSNAERGIETIPQIHLGAEAAAMRSKGVRSELGDEYDRIEIVNTNIRQKLEQIYESESATRDLERQLIEFDRQTDIVTPPRTQTILVVIPDIPITPRKKARDPAQERKDRDFLLVAGEYPELRETPEYAEAKSRHYEYLAATGQLPVVEVLPPAQPAQPAQPPQPRKWEPARVKNNNENLFESIWDLSDRLGNDFEIGNYKVSIFDDRIDVAYKGVLTLAIDNEETRLMQVNELGNTITQYERGLANAIALALAEIVRQEQTQAQEREEELQRQIEQEAQLKLSEPVVFPRDEQSRSNKPVIFPKNYEVNFSESEDIDRYRQQDIGYSR